MDTNDWMKIIVIFGPIEFVVLILWFANWFFITGPIKKYLKERDEFFRLHPTYDIKYGTFRPANLTDPITPDADRQDYIMFHGYQCGLGTVFKAKWDGYLLATNKKRDEVFVRGEPNPFQEYLNKYKCLYLELVKAKIDGLYVCRVVIPTDNGEYEPLVPDYRHQICVYGRHYSYFDGNLFIYCIPDVIFESVEKHVPFDKEALKECNRRLNRKSLKEFGLATSINVFSKWSTFGLTTCVYLFLVLGAHESIPGMLLLTFIYAVLIIRFLVLGV